MSSLVIVAALVVHTLPEPGIWRISADQVDVERKQWSIYCEDLYEKKRQTPRRTAGLEVEVTVDGEDFVVAGGARRFGSNVCEGRNGSLAPASPRREGEVRVFDCVSARVVLGTERGVQQVSSTERHIRMRTDLVQTFKANGDECVSRLSRQTDVVFVRPFPVAGEELAAPDGADAKAPVDPCATKGPLAKLVVEPALHTATVGERPACFRVVGRDENGCVLELPRATWSVDPHTAGAVDADGCFTPAPTSEEQGVGVLVEIEGKDALATVRIIPAGQGQAKKTIAALAKTSKSARVRELLAEVERGELVIRPLSTEASVVAGEEKPLPIAEVVGALGAALFGSLALVALQRRRRRLAPVATELQAAPVAVPTKGGGLQCPQCKFEFAKGEATLCPFDGATLVELERDARQTMFIPVVGGMVCPQCQTRYPTKARFCGHDGTPLLPDFGPSGQA